MLQLRNVHYFLSSANVIFAAEIHKESNSICLLGILNIYQ